MGCASGDGTHAGEKYVVNTQRTLFYKLGPAQSTGPDFALYKGQQLTMQHRQFGFSQVMTEDGQSGYVATEDLAAAPPEPKPERALQGPREERQRRRERAATREEQSQVPAPELPQSAPAGGGFRY